MALAWHSFGNGHPGYYSPRKQKGMVKLSQLSVLNPKFFLFSTYNSYLLYLALPRGNARGRPKRQAWVERERERERGIHFHLALKQWVEENIWGLVHLLLLQMDRQERKPKLCFPSLIQLQSQIPL